MSALRLARGATGRAKFIKFEGCYHGHADALLVKAGSGLATFGHPTSAGVPPEVAKDTIVLPYNDVAALEAAFDAHPRELACVMIEPIAGNMNFVRAAVPFMKRLRELCTRDGALLVFDEVMTGFRVALGSAQSLYAKLIPGFAPDVSVFGKVIGGGMPLAAFGGSKDVMASSRRSARSTRPARSRATRWPRPAGWPRCARSPSPASSRRCRSARASLADGLSREAKDAGVPFCSDSEGGMFGFFFTDALPQNYGTVMATDKERFNRFFHAMLDRGVYLAPALYEAGFVSAAHTRGRHRQPRSPRRASAFAVALSQAGDERRASLAAGPQVLDAQDRVALLAGKGEAEHRDRIAVLDLGGLPRFHARQRREFDVPALVLARRQLRGLEQARAIDAGRLRRHRALRQIGRQLQVGRHVEVQLDMRVAPGHVDRRAFEVDRPRHVETAPAMVGARGQRQRGGRQ